MLSVHYLISLANSLEKGMATHSSILALETPWIEETGRLQSMGTVRGHKELDMTELLTLPLLSKV